MLFALTSPLFPKTPRFCCLSQVSLCPSWKSRCWLCSWAPRPVSPLQGQGVCSGVLDGFLSWGKGSEGILCYSTRQIQWNLILLTGIAEGNHRVVWSLLMVNALHVESQFLSGLSSQSQVEESRCISLTAQHEFSSQIWMIDMSKWLDSPLRTQGSNVNTPYFLITEYAFSYFGWLYWGLKHLEE